MRKRIKNKSPFQKARIELTIWYSFSLTLLVIIFTALTFSAKQSSFVRVYQVVDNSTNNPQELTNFQDQFNKFDTTFKQRVLIFDTIIILLGTMLSYLLSGRTLKPIKRMMKQQQSFAADASHELRTPITIMNMEIEATLRTIKKIPKPIKSTLRSLSEELNHMTAIVQGLLTLVRLDINPDNTEHIATNINILLKKVHTTMLPQAKKQQQNLTLTTKSKTTLTINPHQITQALIILIDNAIKYSGINSTINVSTKTLKDYIAITVHDNGNGIPKKIQKDIFKRFYRGRNDIAGSGLGLNIANNIAKSHQGDLKVSSSARNGTIFTLTLPK